MDLADQQTVCDFVEASFEHLKQSRPTAVNLFEAADRFTEMAKGLVTAPSVEEMKAQLVAAMEGLLEADIADNKAIGSHGAKAILAGVPEGTKVRVLTHCNTGSLATAGYGTALGVIRALHESRDLERAFCTETRPYNQGARLTAYELVHEEIPATLITDSSAAALMVGKGLHAIVVGADRVVANGDTANKIGTYSLAVLAKHHGVPFYVAAPTTSIDVSLPQGSLINIEERSAREISHSQSVQVTLHSLNYFNHALQVVPNDIHIWNPAFDVTPAALITGIITEHGVITKSQDDTVFDVKGFVQRTV